MCEFLLIWSQVLSMSINILEIFLRYSRNRWKETQTQNEEKRRLPSAESTVEKLKKNLAFAEIQEYSVCLILQCDFCWVFEACYVSSGCSNKLFTWLVFEMWGSMLGIVQDILEMQDEEAPVSRLPFPLSFLVNAVCFCPWRAAWDDRLIRWCVLRNEGQLPCRLSWKIHKPRGRCDGTGHTKPSMPRGSVPAGMRGHGDYSLTIRRGLCWMCLHFRECAATSGTLNSLRKCGGDMWDIFLILSQHYRHSNTSDVKVGNVVSIRMLSRKCVPWR